jgi:hypothetical protein
MERMKSITSIAGFWWIGRIAIGLLAFLAFGAIAFTAFELFDAGPSGVAEFGLDSFTYAWPTLLALVFVITEPFLLRNLHSRLRPELVATIAWLGSSLAYARDFQNVSVRSTVAVLMLAGSPILAIHIWRQILARTSMRTGFQLLATVAVALVLAWLTVPMALVVGCAVAGACP